MHVHTYSYTLAFNWPDALVTVHFFHSLQVPWPRTALSYVVAVSNFLLSLVLRTTFPLYRIPMLSISAEGAEWTQQTCSQAFFLPELTYYVRRPCYLPRGLLFPLLMGSWPLGLKAGLLASGRGANPRSAPSLHSTSALCHQAQRQPLPALVSPGAPILAKEA